MSTITGIIETDNYQTKIQARQHAIISDVADDLDGLDTGLSPKELLASSLIGCTCITMRIYADKNKWQVSKINVTVDITLDLKTGAATFVKKISIAGALSPDQKSRLFKIASSCPVHKLLAQTSTITSILIDE